MSDVVIKASAVSKWYGHVLGVSDIETTIRGGIIGLLGPNGAGKSTLMKMIVGLLKPSRGTIEVFGRDPFTDQEARCRIGYCPEHEGMYDELSALEFVAAMAELAGVARSEAVDRASAALDEIGLKEAKNRRIAGFSKGMRQRTKLAQCMVHDPDLLILDEPLTGVDPVARAELVARIRAFGEAGKTVLVSSHVLYEVEAMTEEILVIYRGQVLAEGNLFEIRALIDKHPHRIRVECDRPRELGHGVAGADHVARLSFERNAVVIETENPDACYDLIGQVVLDEKLLVRSMTSPDNNLGAVFEYLTGQARR